MRDTDASEEIPDIEESAPVEEILPVPTPSDPPDASIPLPGYESLVIPYPSTIRIVHSNERFCRLMLLTIRIITKI
jgi:hypothetical protein